MGIGERLRCARDRAGLTLGEVEERTNIGKSSLSEYETGKRDPKVSQLAALAEVYHRSVDFFLRDEPIPEEKVLWRMKPESSASQELEGRFLQLCEQYQNLEVWCGEVRPWSLPEAGGRAKDFGYPEAEKLANRVRTELELGERPGQSLRRVLEEVCRLKIFHLRFGPSGSAACTKSGSFGLAVLLNAESARWRRNLDLAHELFHLLTWDIFRSENDAALDMPPEKEEKLATCFAGRVLMPDDVTRDAVQGAVQGGKLTLEALFDVARQFDVSVEALLWRMHFIFNRSEEQTKADIERSRGCAALFEDRESDQPPERPARYWALALKALRQGRISQGTFAAYVGISRKEAERYLEPERAGDEEIAFAPA